jgi:DNA-binding response OmpR family regulator
MQDKDAAKTLPESGNMKTLDEASLKDVQGFVRSVHSRQQQLEEVKAARYILVVEDDASLARLEGEILTAHGYVVVIAGNGELAIAALLQYIPDLVLLDLELSGTVNGWDVLRTLRAHARIPVLLTSAESTVRKQMRTSGENKSTLDHLAKPYPMQTLLKRIQRMLMIAP